MDTTKQLADLLEPMRNSLGHFMKFNSDPENSANGRLTRDTFALVGRWYELALAGGAKEPARMLDVIKRTVTDPAPDYIVAMVLVYMHACTVFSNAALVLVTNAITDNNEADAKLHREMHTALEGMDRAHASGLNAAIKVLRSALERKETEA